jgi:SAM-dependent methyltransferase
MSRTIPFETDHTAVELRLLERALPAGGTATVLEAGCGRTTRLVAVRDRIGELVGMDVDVAAGEENDALDRFVEGDLCKPLPFDDASFDLVYANFVVEHLDRPSAAFAEWHRVLRPDGHLLLVTSNRASPVLRAAELLPQSTRVVIKQRGAGAREDDVFPAVYRANTPRQLREQLEAAGFAPVSVLPVATLDRYAGGRRAPAAILRAGEHALPPWRRSTIVGLWQVR